MFATLATMAFAAPAYAATITVDTTADNLTANGQCSLREAITAANTDAVVNAGAGECPAGQGADVVVVGAGTFKVTRNVQGDDTNQGGDFDVLGTELTIQGAGAAQTIIDGNQLDRVFDIRPGRIATISGVTVTGGRARDGGNGSSFTGDVGQAATGGNGQPGQPGGGISNDGNLTILDSTVTANVAGTGGRGGNAHGGDGQTNNTGASANSGFGGPAGTGGSGGGIYTTGVLIVTRVTVSSNTAGNGGAGGTGTGGQGGGGVTGGGGAGGYGGGGLGGSGGGGGGIAEQGGGSVTIDQSVLEGNRAGNGGPNGFSQGGPGGLAAGGAGAGGAGGAAGIGIAGTGGDGGGVSSLEPAVISRSLLSGNASGDGANGGNASGGPGGEGVGPGRNGGPGGSATLAISGPGGNGGALTVINATLTDVTLTGNSTGHGGNTGGTATGGNGGASDSGTAGAGGNASGGIAASGGSGGAAWLPAGNSNWTHVTITANTLGPTGSYGTVVAGTGSTSGTTTPGSDTGPPQWGALYVQGTATVANSIMAANAAPGCTQVTDGGNNISQADATCPGADVDPLLGALADNGGPSETQALGAASPAIGLVPSTGAGCAATDQRLVVRPQGAACDAGAYEFAPPAVSTTDATAVTLSGAALNAQVNPNARATTFHFEFGATDAYGTSTADQSAGSGVAVSAVTAVLDNLAPGTTFHYRVVAANADGQSVGEDKTFTTLTPPAPGGGGPTGGDKTAPVFTSASLNPKTFAVNGKGRTETPVAARAKKGTTIKFSLSEAARVVFTVEQKLPGRRVGGKCKPQTKKNRKQRACTRFVRVGRFAVAAKAGANTKKWSGRIGKKSLARGSYRLTLVATDAARNKSAPKRLTFKVVRS